MSIMACSPPDSSSATASASRGVKSRWCPSRLPPRWPVTSIRSPGCAPLLSTGPPDGDSPITVTLITSGPSVLVVSPPASATPVSLARPARPECSRWAGSPCQLRGRATETTAAIGRPAIAAMSLRLTARDLRPTCSGVASGQVKCTPSTSMSTAISVESVSGQDTDAASSPMPTSSRGWGPACRRIQSIRANSPPGRSGDRGAGEGC